MLYNSGYHTVTDVARAEPSDIENLFRNAVPFQRYFLDKCKIMFSVVKNTKYFYRG